MRKSSAIALAIGLFAFAGAAQAAGDHGGGSGHSAGFSSGGGHGGFHGGHGHGGSHGGGAYHHGHGYYGYGLGIIGLGLGAYYDGSPYWDAYGANDYSDGDGGDYSDAPPDANAPPPPPDSTGPGGTPYWYHCNSPEGYYPYVKTCRNWQPVPAAPPQNSGD